jgi:cytochrome c oxidase subunit 2
MKKLLLLVMGLTLVFVLAACGSKPDASAPAASSSTTPTASSATTATPAAGGASGQNITLKASNFKYEQAEYKVKKGEPVTITLQNAQGMHGAAIKDFGVDLKKEGESKTFTPDKTGSFPIVCSIMCGAGHADMKATLIVE